MKGKYPREYFLNPNIDKPIQEIWDDIDAYTGEFMEDETNLHKEIDFIIPIPPLKYKNKTTKGVFFTQGCEYLLKLFPDIKKIFFAGAYTMWSSYSWCDKADIYFSCYENKERENYHKNKYQNKKDIIFLPLQDADYTNEYIMAPTFNTPKTIDVLCVSTPAKVKNIPILAKALLEYEKKYKKILNTVWIMGIKTKTKDFSDIRQDYRTQINQIKEILKSEKYLNMIPFVQHKDLAKYYSRAKCCVLASLIEGKNRSLNESMSCNTPIVVFKDHNKYARGNHPIFFGNSGELAEFSPESLADTIHKVINNQDNYCPRENYLKYNGRRNFVDVLANKVPYYKENIPNFEQTKFHENLWVDLATQDNYQISYHDFIYGKNPLITHVRGTENIRSLIEFFYSRFNIK